MDGSGRAIRDGVALSWRDFGGDGPPVILLHGLAGYGEEWAQTAAWLTARARVIAPDARGHGHSECRPADVSPAALVDDAAWVIERLGLGPVVAVGQSLGGLTALSLAAGRPDLVRGVVLVEASPDGGPPEEAARVAATVGQGLASWPVPFASVPAATAFFTDRFGSEAVGVAWAAGLESRADGLWPRFDAGVMERMLAQALAGPRWAEWESLDVPALVVRGERGTLAAATAGQMIERLAGARQVAILDAGHDLHLEQPRSWQTALSGFLDRLDLPAQSAESSSSAPSSGGEP